ncbi:MAG: DUF4382 domain-containing protein [Chloroflexota bacterium]
MKTKFTFILSMFALLLATACQSAATGELEIRANGEGFVREGFVSKDGWQIDFDHVYVSLSDIGAYQTDPPFDAESGAAPSGTAVELSNAITLDLAEGGPDADTILISTESGVPIGQFNAVSWQMAPASNGPIEGQTIQLVGIASKDGETINFTINIDESYGYTCGEFVGDERKGFVTEDAAGDVELTFHFDHVFGDFETAMDEAINVSAVGFDPLAALSNNGELNIGQSDLESQLSAEDFDKMFNNLQTLGHVGEGHCYEAARGWSGNK